jgi:predicted permease
LSVALLLFPDFTLILLGVLLKRYARFETPFWSGLERMVYFILFPSLLFASTATAKLDLGATAGLIAGCVAAMLTGIVLGYLARPILKPAPDVFASGVQCAFRFNSYIALALAGRLAGSEGIALMAVALGISVPIANVGAVYALARHRKTGILGEMARNPLIIATVGGLAFNFAGIALPEFVLATFQRLGSASIALGLIAVGAGLRLAGALVERPLLGWLIFVKLVAAPAVVFALVTWLHLPPLQRQIAILFAALPSASSAYILAVRMGGNGAIVAFLISASTVLSVITLPIWIIAAR